MTELKPPPHLSPSSIGTWKQCPLKFKYSKIDGIREPPTEATLMGNFVHEILEDVYALEPEERTIDVARQIARRIWDEKYSSEVHGYVHTKKLNDFRWNSWFCVENLWALEQPSETFINGIEYELNGQIEGVTLKGFIDRYSLVDGHMVIGDYKTGKVPRKQWEEDKFTQLFIYSALVQELGVAEVDQVELLYLKGPKKISREVTPQHIEEVTETIVTVKHEIDKACEDENFPTVKSKLCDWCFFKKQCPAWRR